MFLENHRYVFGKTYVCFFENKGMFFQKQRCVSAGAPRCGRKSVVYKGFRPGRDGLCDRGAIGRLVGAPAQTCVAIDSLMRAFGFDDVKPFSHRLSLIYA